MAIKRFDERQLSFDLENFDEEADVARDLAVSQDEARLISEAARSTFESQDKLPDWFRDYRKLIEQGWPWRVATYIAWCSSPKAYRKPDTLQELAIQVLGLKSPRVIYEWRRNNPGIDTIISMMQAAPLWEHRADVLKTLANMAMREDYKSFNDRKLFLELIGDYTPKSQLDVRNAGVENDLSSLSEADLMAMAGGKLAIGNQDEDADDISDANDDAD